MKPATLRFCALLALLLASTAGAQPAANETILDHGRFKQVHLFRPAQTPTSFALLLSGDGGWNAGETRLAQTLVGEGALVAGIDSAQFVAVLEADDGDCALIDGDLENLAHFSQAYAKVAGYLQPILVGYSAGASLAYANLLQAPAGTFSSALLLGFCPELEMKKPMCAGEALRYSAQKSGKGFDLLAEPALKAPLIALYGRDDDLCDIPSTQKFIDRISSAQMTVLSGVNHGYGDSPSARTAMAAAYRRLQATAVVTDAPAPPSLGDLPVIEEPAENAAGNPHFAVLLSGDGGWAGLDKDVSAALRAKGISVVGVDSLRYFWSARTPQDIATDLDRIIDHYAALWHKREVILVGYSQGADVLPFALNRLSTANRRRLAVAVAIGLSEHAVFQFHLTNWVSDNDDGPATLPEVQRLRDVRFLCVYGAEEDDSICPQLRGTGVALAQLPGGHHFDGDYEALAATILAHLSADSRKPASP